MKKELFAKDVGYELNGSFCRNDPFTINFVYPRNERPFILKGGKKKVNESILELQKLGMKAVIWGLDYLKAGSTGEKRISKTLGTVIGLPPEYSAFIKKLSPAEKNWAGYPINKNHKYCLKVLKRTKDGNDIILAKSFKNHPRCFPKCLDQFIPVDEQVPMKNSVSIH